MSSIQPSSFSKQFASLEITGIQLTGKILGKGSDATVKEVNWVGTSCAAKQLHEILLEDDSPGGAKRFIDNFEKECMTWSKLIHPHIVQFLGVYFLSGSRVPTLILEKMDTSLRHYLEKRTEGKFALSNKIYVLRQVAQALSYLHSRSPPLVHHDLSPNNVLLNEVSLQAKVTDFGMTRAMDPSKMTRKSSAKGTHAFMPPEALHSPPKYNEKLDVFSYGNVIVTTVIHDWPEPGPPTKYEGDKLIGLTEFQRREQYLNRFNQIENNLFLPIVSSCLENRPHQRPSSFHLVTRMREIEGSHPRVPATSSSTVPLSQDQSHLHQELTIKENIIRQKDAQLQQKDVQLGQLRAKLQQQDAQLQQQDAQLQQQDAQLQQQDAQLKQQDAQLQQQDAQLQQQDAQLKQQDAQLQQQDAQLQQQDAQLKQQDAQLQQQDAQLQQKDAQLREQTAQFREQDAKLKQQHTLLQQKDAQFKQKDAELRRKDEESGRQYAVLLHEHQKLQQEHHQQRRERDQVQRESSHSLSTKPVSCSHLFVSSLANPTSHSLSLPSLNGLSYIVPPILPQSL